MSGAWAALRNARYALPAKIERLVSGPGPAATVRTCHRLRRKGLAATVGYFQATDARPEEIVLANTDIAGLLAAFPGDACLSVKAPPLGFDYGHLRTIAGAAAAAGLPLMFDAHAAKDADRTLELAAGLLPERPDVGLVLPARWRRSVADAAAFRDTSARIRVVKGEWTDPQWGDPDIAADYLRLIAALAGRAAPVAVATHDPALAEQALGRLLAAGTPCELEQLRGLPRRRTVAIAGRLGVPVRVYVPFGPGWWPYAVDRALARPYLPWWMMKDWLASPKPQAQPSI